MAEQIEFKEMTTPPPAIDDLISLQKATQAKLAEMEANGYKPPAPTGPKFITIAEAESAKVSAEIRLNRAEANLNHSKDNPRRYNLNQHDEFVKEWEAAKLALMQAENGVARSTRMTAEAKVRAEKDKAQAAIEAKAAAQKQAQARATYHARFIAAGGTEAQFNEAWPSMWLEILKKSAMAEDNDLKARMRQQYGL